MTSGNIQIERLLKFLLAPPQVREQIDRILDGKELPRSEPLSGPLLLGMTQAAALLGCSRTSLWRLIQSGRLEKVELLPGSYRVRRADLEEFIRGKDCPGNAAAKS